MLCLELVRRDFHAVKGALQVAHRPRELSQRVRRRYPTLHRAIDRDDVMSDSFAECERGLVDDSLQKGRHPSDTITRMTTRPRREV